MSDIATDTKGKARASEPLSPPGLLPTDKLKSDSPLLPSEPSAAQEKAKEPAKNPAKKEHKHKEHKEKDKAQKDKDGTREHLHHHHHSHSDPAEKRGSFNLSAADLSD